MATKKVTITLPEEQVAAMRDLVALGQADSISGFVHHAVNTALNEVELWRMELDAALERTGGPLTEEEIAWADEILGHSRREP
ncbi:MAG: toxin-antitoxin system antitoxin subunit [Actinomycetia bacterium]|nr:toxin-antitoxin system antitoxin subunit [Actinomycetes bacterium]